jgi:FdhD protein
MARAPSPTERREILRIGGAGVGERQTDTVVREVQLRLVVDDRDWAEISMLPGEERELTYGMLLSAGVIGSAADVMNWRHDVGTQTAFVQLARAADRSVVEQARIIQRSASGHQPNLPVALPCNPVNSELQVSGAALLRAAESLRQGAGLFRETGAVHSAALCRADGEVLLRCDDIGRHNACDKVIGAALLGGDLQAADCFMFCTCRLSSEIVIKAWCFGVPLLASRAAPTTRALELAERAGITLTGFIRDDRLNLYCGAQRIEEAGRC